mmetsp:Transcript_7239/g.22365  ORF Transcript_7239/g.22365 Transcript_7239/m.22365 type:complete len:279 (-) Transcript_7239:599-1435(-)|eukprot:scaffold254959_cov27-Tisochrysis_lutea.AAC.4
MGALRKSIGACLAGGPTELRQLYLHPDLVDSGVIVDGIAEGDHANVNAHRARRNSAMARSDYRRRENERPDGTLGLCAANRYRGLVQVRPSGPEFLDIQVGVADQFGRARGSNAHKIEKYVRFLVVGGFECTPKCCGSRATAFHWQRMRKVEAAPRFTQARLFSLQRCRREVEQVNLDPSGRVGVFHCAAMELKTKETQGDVGTLFCRTTFVATDDASAVGGLDGCGRRVRVGDTTSLQRYWPRLRGVAKLDSHREVSSRLETSVLERQLLIEPRVGQ